jgi:hypothetical protein
VRVHTSPAGGRTLDPGSPPGLGIGLLAAGGVLAMLWVALLLLKLRDWGAVLQGVGELIG